MLTEQFMRLLEELDKIEISEDQHQSRSRRKAVVVKIQKYLVKCDHLVEDIEKCLSEDSDQS